tara:strand:+ start:758 stop:2056 length:1299 start_codon:yes stop_codon:yes gene_type:complete
MIKNYNLHKYILFILIFSNFFLGHGFQTYTFINIPVTYIFLFILLFNISLKDNFKHLKELGILNIWFLYFFFNLFKMLIGFSEFGIAALRDATYILDSIFLIVFISFIKDESDINNIDKILKITFYFLFFFVFTWLYKDFFIPLSPKIVSPLGVTSNLFFNYSTFNIILCLFAFYSFIFLKKPSNKKIFFIVFSILAFILAPKRQIYLTYISTLLFLIFIDKKNTRLMFNIFWLLVILQIFEYFNLFSFLKINDLSFSNFFKNHILSSFPGYQTDILYFQGTQSTIDWRLENWTSVINKVSSNYKTFLFGLSYGETLTTFINAEGIANREPHNLWVTLYGRMGFLGFLMFFILHYKIIKILFYSFKLSSNSKNLLFKNIIIFTSIFNLYIFFGGGINASTLSTSYLSSQFYILNSLVISIYFYLKKKENLVN